MITDVGLVKVLTDSVVVLRWLGETASETDALWSRCKLRKATQCAVTEIDLKSGDTAWRPVGNQDYRMYRISDLLMVELLRLAQQQPERTNDLE